MISCFGTVTTEHRTTALMTRMHLLDAYTVRKVFFLGIPFMSFFLVLIRFFSFNQLKDLTSKPFGAIYSLIMTDNTQEFFFHSEQYPHT